MQWAVQSSGVSDHNTSLVFDALYDLKIPYQDVGVIPFTDKIVNLERVRKDDKVVFYGSTKLVQLVRKLNYTPGVFFDYATFNVLEWRTQRRDTFLNATFFVRTVGSILNEWHMPDEVFVRPMTDLKDFCGQVVAKENRSAWFDHVTLNPEITPETFVLVSEKRIPEVEYRFFVVGHKVISGSQYRIDGRLNPSSEIPSEALKAATELALGWMPSEVSVMDVGLFEGKYYIVEFNCFNASGFYKADVSRVVQAVTQKVMAA